MRRGWGVRVRWGLGCGRRVRGGSEGEGEGWGEGWGCGEA